MITGIVPENGVVEMGIEGFAYRLKPLDSVSLQHLKDLPLDCRYAAQDLKHFFVRRIFLGQTVERPSQIVHNGEEIPPEFGVGVAHRLFAVALDTATSAFLFGQGAHKSLSHELQVQF